MKKTLVILMSVMLIMMVFGCTPKDTTDTPTNTTATDAPAVTELSVLEQAATNYFAEFPGSRIITWTDLFAKIDAGDEPFILSIRQNDVYTTGHIVGAYLASWGTDLADKVAMLPTDQPVYVYCYTGQTAGQTVALLNLLGIEAYSVKAGYNSGAMLTEGYEAYVETTVNDLTDAGAEFDADVLEFVQGYFNSVADNANFIMAASAAATLIDAGDLTVMDIRTADDYNLGHIDGAINVPFGAGMQENFAQFEGKKIIVACYSGQTAGQTVGVLRALGYDAVSLKSGMGASGWTSYVKTTAANAYFAPAFANPMITWEALFEKIDAGEELNIVSIRQQDVYDAGHIVGAARATWGADLAEKVALLPTDEPVYVYCYSGQTAGQAVALMRMLGIDAYSVRSGFDVGATAIEGYEAYVSTDAVELENAGAEFNPFLLAEVQAYFNAVSENASFKIGWDDALAAVEAGEATVIDIRQADVFAEGHIQGAINIPFGENMQESFVDLPAGKLIVACYTGQTAGQTTAVLRMLGKDAVSLHYGMTAGWIANGYPVVTD